MVVWLLSAPHLSQFRTLVEWNFGKFCNSDDQVLWYGRILLCLRASYSSWAVVKHLRLEVLWLIYKAVNIVTSVILLILFSCIKLDISNSRFTSWLNKKNSAGIMKPEIFILLIPLEYSEDILRSILLTTIFWKWFTNSCRNFGIVFAIK